METKKNKILLLFFCTICFVSCEKEEQYASATINGVEYVENKTSMLPFFDTSPSSISIWENYNVALYHTLLTPLTGDNPYYDINFWILLGNNSELKINKSYKIWGVKVFGEYDWQSTITQLKEKLPTGYDGIVYCYKEGIAESFSLEGELKLERYDASTEYYYGSYQLTNSSTMSEPLTVIGNFRIVENKTQLTYP